jgi:hypothetical protein
MEREYRSYIEHKKKTGEGNKKQPEFFETTFFKQDT